MKCENCGNEEDWTYVLRCNKCGATDFYRCDKCGETQNFQSGSD